MNTLGALIILALPVIFIGQCIHANIKDRNVRSKY